MTRQQLRERILERLNESVSSPVHFSAAQIDSSIAEALEILAEETEAVKRTVFVPLRPGTTFYTTFGIAADMMVPYRLYTLANNRRLNAVSIGELDEYSEVWEDSVGTPESWFPVSWDMFGVYPHPTEGGGVIRVDYMAWPRELLDDADEPELPEASEEGIIDYGVYDGLIKRYDTETAMQFLQKFAALFKDSKVRSGVGRLGNTVFQRTRKPQIDFPSAVRGRTVGESRGV